MQPVDSSLETLLSAAVEIANDNERDAYLRRACGSDGSKLADLQSMVRDFFAAGSIIDRPAAVAPTLAAESTSHISRQIGPYKLRELLGEGGMGSVYVAEQEKPVRRKVALKIIKPGMGSREVISRFESERQALALMDHPNIARVLDAGTTDSGLPYFVMELVKGLPITEHCDAQKLGTRDRLELFLQVCQAIQHAHQKGIIHRDIKPSNVIVAIHDVTPVVKVIDFGIAKAIGQQLTDNSLYTAVSQMVGTPLYMSPEQAGQSSLDIDTRSDVYSLGVLLYELLTGNTPFDKDILKQAGIDEMRRIIREVEPPKPSTRVSTLNAEAQSTVAGRRQIEPRKLSQQFRGELDWIVMKAIEKDRNRRYDSANSLAKDVERYLNNATVEACPPSTTYRLRKLFRRNKSAVLTTSVVLVALIAATGTTVTLAIRENQVAQRRLLVQRGINDALAEVASLRGQGTMTALGDKNALTRAREQIQRARALVDTGEADAHLTAQVRQLASELDLEQRDGQLLAALEAAGLAATNLDWDRRFANDKSIHLLRDALAADGLTFGQDDPQAVAGRIKSRNEMVQAEIVAALYEWYSVLAPPIGVVLKGSDGLVNYVSPESVVGRDGGLKKNDQIVGIGQGRGASVTSTAGMAAPQIMQLLRGEPGTIVRLEVLSKPANESRILEIQRDPTAAWLWAVIQAADPDPWRRNVRDACNLEDGTLPVAELEKLVGEADILKQPLRFLNQLAAELTRANAIDRATALLEQVWQAHPGDVSTNLSLAICLRRKKPAQKEESLRYYTAVIAMRPDSSSLRNMRGLCFLELEKTDEAIADFREAVRLDQNWATAHTNLGSTLARQGKSDESIAELSEAIRLDRQQTILHYNLGIALQNQGKPDEAVNEYREAIRLNPKYPNAFNNLGYILSSQGKSEEAIAEYRKALQLKPFAGAHLVHTNLGNILWGQGKLAEAVNEFREAIRLEPKHLKAHLNLGAILASQGNHEEGIAEFRTALQLAPSAEDAYLLHTNLGTALGEQGKLDEAINELSEAIELKPNNAMALNGLAWLLAASPDPKMRKPTQALELAIKAVQLAPENGGYLNTLGVAQYRNGHWETAIEVLEKSIELQEDLFSSSGFFLAMSHWQLDEKTKARSWYDQSVEWMEKNQPTDKELQQFRTEVAELLGIKE